MRVMFGRKSERDCAGILRGRPELYYKKHENPVIGDFCKGIPGVYENHPVKGAIGRYNEQDQEIHPKSSRN